MMRKNYCISILIIFLLSISFFNSNAQGKKISSLSEAKEAFRNFDLLKSRSIYTELILSKSISKHDKVEAYQNLAFQDWAFFLNYASSIKNLKIAISLQEEECKSYLQLAQINMEAEKFVKAKGFVKVAKEKCNSKTEKIATALLNAQVVHNESLILLKKRKSPNKQELLDAAGLLKYVLKNQPGNTFAAELLMGVALLNKNGEDLFAAWKSYYFIADENKVNHVLKPSYDILNTIISKWKDGDLSKSEKFDLIKCLSSSNFYKYAALLATSSYFGEVNTIENSEINNVIYFNQFINGVNNVNSMFYPQIARGLKGYNEKYKTAIVRVEKILWSNLNEPASKFSQESFFQVINRKYRALGYMDSTNNYFSLLLGLIMHDEIKEVIQYGYKAKFRYISISNLVSPDFTTWYWHGDAQVGGWGTDTAMIQIRDAYLKGPITRLSWVTDTTEYNKIVSRIETARKTDFIQCKKELYTEPSYLALSIKLNASKTLYDSLKMTGLSDDVLAATFIAETIRLNIDATVFGHEGRHSIDQLFFKTEFDTLTNDEKELRAKYSEIIFSENPKLALTGSIFGLNMNRETAHGKANYRMLKIFVSWMQQHAAEIENYKPEIPLTMQIEQLSNEQIRNICLMADPLKKMELNNR